MSTSIVLELQALALNKDHDVSDLLRKAYLVSKKLNLKTTENWLKSELNGYQDEVPHYRVVCGELKARNPYHGWQPVQMDVDVTKAITKIHVTNSIADLQHLVEKVDSYVFFPLDPKIESLMNINLPLTRFVSVNALVAIIDSVRTKILEWSFELEQEGILGDGITFSTQEKETAMSNSNINIQHFNGILGNVTNSEISQNINTNITYGNIDSILDFFRKEGILDEDLRELEDALVQEPKLEADGSFGKKVSAWIGRMIQKASSGAWKISIGVAGALITEALKKYYIN